MTAKRRIVFSFIGLIALAGVSWTMRPQACDYEVDGGLNLGRWSSNVAARLTSGEEDCDPWSQIAAEELTGQIALMWHTSSIGGPIQQYYVISPDGRIEVWRELWLPYELGEDTPDYAYSFDDPAIYALAAERLAPLREWTHPIPMAELIDLKPTAKSQLACNFSSDMGGIDIFWGGSLEMFGGGRGAFRDISYFERQSGKDCPVASSAFSRLEEVLAAIDSHVPTHVYDAWSEIERANRHRP